MGRSRSCSNLPKPASYRGSWTWTWPASTTSSTAACRVTTPTPRSTARSCAPSATAATPSCPSLFTRIHDFSELLLPADLLSPQSVLQALRDTLTKEVCADEEVIGWLYQFYISEKKDAVFAAKGKVKKEDIPAVTQLFTPRWIVEYMVQNTLGKPLAASPAR